MVAARLCPHHGTVGIRTHDEAAMRGPKLDRIDRQILALLQSDGRMTNIELARRVGISPPPCLRRVRTLEEAG
jgi:predicted ArsR family transcriptional regulator